MTQGGGPRRPLERWIPGLIAALAASAMVSWGLGNAALWRDEGATTVAIRRTWTALWQLMGGSEAPLVPYYAVLKFCTGVTSRLLPGSPSHVEAFERWPSAVAMVLACWVLVHWLTRISSYVVAAAAGGLFVLLFGLSRYGQEARPYAMVTAMAVVATVLWWQLATSRRPWFWSVPYALAVGSMVALHALSATLLAAHLAAAACWRQTADAEPGSPRAGSPGAAPGAIGTPGRFARIAWTLGAAAGGAALASPLTLSAIHHGTGAAGTGSGNSMLDVFLRLINGDPDPGGPVVVLLVVVLIGLPVAALLTQWSGSYANLVRLATAWALLPLGLLTLAAAQRPNLVAARYLVFILPGWALLSGIGLAALATGLASAVRRIQPGADTWIVTSAVLVAVLSAVAIVQVPSLQLVRSSRGHDEDVRVVLAVVNRPELRALPIEVFPAMEALQISAYEPGLAKRLINLHQQVTGPVIWPQRLPGKKVAVKLRQTQRLIILIRGTSGFRAPQPWDKCRVATQVATDRKWSYVILERAEPANAQAACPS